MRINFTVFLSILLLISAASYGQKTTFNKGEKINIDNNNLGSTPTVRLADPTYFNSESQNLTVVILREGDLTNTSSVTLNTTDSTATGGTDCTTAGIDYVSQNMTVNFDVDESEFYLDIPLCGDAQKESNETFTINLTTPTSNANIGSPSTATATINDTASQYISKDFVRWFNESFPYPSILNVTNAPTKIDGLRITFYNLFDFGSVDDIDVLLVGPQGQQIILMADAGGGSTMGDATTITFDDDAGVVLPDSSMIPTGLYEPTSWETNQSSFPTDFTSMPPPPAPYNEPGNTVGGAITLGSVFNGTNANGDWKLYVRIDNGQPFQAIKGIRGGFGNGWGLQFFAVTAADVSIGGNVRNGNTPIPSVNVILTGGDLSQPIYTKTNRFGRYNFEGLNVGQTYVVTVFSKKYAFAQNSIAVSPQDNVSNIDFETVRN